MKTLAKATIVISCLIFSGTLFADIITLTEAKKAAKNFYWQQAADQLHTAYDKLSADLIETRRYQDMDLIHIFNMDNHGFVMISGWDGTIPVPGYSTESVYNGQEQDLPPAFAEMLDFYEKQISEAIIAKTRATPEIEETWEKLLGSPQPQKGSRSVNPLLTTTWNQSCYYNELCPEDDDAPFGYCGHVPVGCVALAMAQVMKYWDYPATGTGSHTYYAAPYGWQSADFSNTTYNWDNMPNNINSSNLSVATLLYHCAVSVDMQFGPNGSGASTADALTALENYFNYDPAVQFYYKSSYSDDVWENMLRDELDLGRPVIYRGQGTGGHAWVCDGYTEDDYFHMNWGWGGYANGNFYLSDLSPAGQNFTNNQAAIMNIIPGDAIVEPPQNLQAEVNGNDIQLTWLPPLEPQWIHWDDGSTSGVLSMAGGGSFDAAARWAPGDLNTFDGLYITKVSVYLGSELPEYEVKIWTGENATNLVYSEPINNIISNNWNTLELSSALQIDASTDLYIGVSVIDQPNGESSVGRDSGPAVEGRGGMISFNGSTWSELLDYGLNFNWNIQAYVNTSNDGKGLATKVLQSGESYQINTTELISMPVKPGEPIRSPKNRDLLGYNIYRNGSKINENVVPETSYTDEDLTPGTYEYYITSLYNAGESAPSNTVSATSGLTVENLQLNAGWNSISSLLLPPNPDVENICEPVTDHLVIIQNMNTAYCPELNINTLQEWDFQSGYLIKVNQDCNLPFEGLTNTNRTITLNNGWNLIPVLSECEVDTEGFFADIVTYIRVVKDAAGSGVYWPSKGVNTLPVLEPGKAYYVKIFSSKTLTFPSCE